MTGVTATIVPIIAQQPAAPVEFLDLIDIRTADADGTQPDGAQPPFPTELLPHPFRGFVEDIADRKQVPADFAGIPTIIMAATAIGSAIHLRPMKHDDWSERPCLWGVVISPTGTMKSPTMDAATKPLKDHELARKKVWKTEYEAWKALPEDARKYTPAPIRDRYITNNATTEKIVHLMTPEGNGTPGHLLFYADELTAFFGGMDRYSKGSDGGDRAFFLTCHSGGPYNSDRVTEGRSNSVDDCYLSIVGGIQPGKVAELFRGGEVDGLTARFGLAVEPKPMEQVLWVDKRPDYDARHKVKAWINEVSSRGPREEPHRLDGLAYAIASRWLEETRRRAEAARGTSFGAHLAKYPGLYVRLMLVFHYMKHDAFAPAEVDSETATVAKRFIDEYLEPHARRLYGLIEAHPAMEGARRIAEWIGDSGKGHARVRSITLRDVRRKGWKEFAHAKNEEQAILDALKLLDAYGWLRLRERFSGVKGGRPTIEAVVNPKAYEG